MTNKAEELKAKLYKTIEETNTSKKGMEILVDYYIKTLGWSEEQAYEYALGLFHDGTITQIKMFGKDGEELC
jgi:hypothetical protein